VQHSSHVGGNSCYRDMGCGDKMYLSHFSSTVVIMSFAHLYFQNNVT